MSKIKGTLIELEKLLKEHDWTYETVSYTHLRAHET